jgi:toxin ParE1/3/4
MILQKNWQEEGSSKSEMKLLWTHEALGGIFEIEKYIAEDNPSRAKEFSLELIKRTQSILKNPRRGRIVPEYLISDLRELIYKNYIIVYKINNNVIVILTVFESHRLIRNKEVFKNI